MRFDVQLPALPATNKNMKFFQQEFKAMGTLCDIQLFAKTATKAKQVAGIVIADVKRLEQRYSRYRDDSFLSKINRVAARGGSIKVDPETAGLLNYAVTCHQESDGLFDITSGILRQAWRFDRTGLPDEKHIQSLLDKIGWHKVLWNSPSLDFPMPGMEIDFGGIVKEYAVDRAAALCWTEGIHHGVVNLGGDIKVIGPRADHSPWLIGIRHPRQTDAVLETLSLHEGALASSGDYERCILSMGSVMAMC
jgi:thiamine biosynthesis lipoprotein